MVAGCETFILNLAPNERFEGFVEFKKYQDIGFFPGKMTIESCSHFLFLTHDENCNSKHSNRLNLLLINKFH